MTLTWRTAFALVIGSAAACVPILGLDDLRERDKPTQNDSGGDVVTAVNDGGRPCVRHAECVVDAGGNPSLCAANQCVDVNTQLCLQQIRPYNDILTKYGDEDVIVIAAFMRFDTTSPLQSGPGLAYDLALTEIEGAEGIRGNQRRHRLAMLICDSDPAKVQDSVKHVVNDLKVPAILASFGSGQLADLVPGTVAEAGVFTMNPSFTTDVLKFTPTEGLVWSLLGTAEDVARAYRPVFQELKDQKFGDPNIDLKVALVATDGSLDKAMADAVQRGPRNRTGEGGAFETSKALDMAGKAPDNTLNFERIDIASIEKTDNVLPSILAAKTKLIDSNPDVIIALTANELDGFVIEVDDALVQKNAGNPTRKPPFWILGPQNGGTVVNGKKTALGNHLSAEDASASLPRRARFFGVQYAGATDPTERDLWQGRMLSKFPDAAASGALASENFYDAIYWLAFGFAAAGPNAKVEGKWFSTGVENLVSGETRVFAGDPETLRRSFQIINNLDPVTFVGALGPPDINVPKGTWNSVGAVYCYEPAGKDAVPSYDKLRYLPDGGLSNSGSPVNCKAD